MAGPVIELSGVEKRYGGHAALTVRVYKKHNAGHKEREHSVGIPPEFEISDEKWRLHEEKMERGRKHRGEEERKRNEGANILLIARSVGYCTFTL